MRRLTIALACVALSFAPGCGGDDEGSTAGKRPPPLPTIPQDPNAPDEDTDEDATTDEAAPVDPVPVEPDPGSGGAPAPPPEPVPDSPTNDTAPPEGSPAERFEEFCNENPGACG